MCKKVVIPRSLCSDDVRRIIGDAVEASMRWWLRAGACVSIDLLPPRGGLDTASRAEIHLRERVDCAGPARGEGANRRIVFLYLRSYD